MSLVTRVKSIREKQEQTDILKKEANDGETKKYRNVSNDSESDISNETLIDKTLELSNTEDCVKVNTEVNDKTSESLC